MNSSVKFWDAFNYILLFYYSSQKVRKKIRGIFCQAFVACSEQCGSVNPLEYQGSSAKTPAAVYCGAVGNDRRCIVGSSLAAPSVFISMDEIGAWQKSMRVLSLRGGKGSSPAVMDTVSLVMRRAHRAGGLSLTRIKLADSLCLYVDFPLLLKLLILYYSWVFLELGVFRM